jgi:hypothetical protein
VKDPSGSVTKTNAAAYRRIAESFLPIDTSAYEKARRGKKGVLGKVLRGIRNLSAPRPIEDDFDWEKYHLAYRAEIEWHDRLFTLNLGTVDFRFVEHKLYLPGDCKPVHYYHRCLWEAICNLPAFRSVAEIGVGAGYSLVSLKHILGADLVVSGYDLRKEQLAIFGEYYPEEFRNARTGVLDITESPIEAACRPDVVFQSTVIMHIKRPSAYEAALRNFLESASQFAVMVDHFPSHDYFADLSRIAPAPARKLYFYDSGACIAIVVSLRGAELHWPYQPLTNGDPLSKYL